MFNRTAVVWLLVGALAGYLFGSPAIEAQRPTDFRPPFVALGDNIRLRFERGTLNDMTLDSSVNCLVTAVQEMWVRCGPEDKLGIQRDEKWYSFKRVVEITKRER